MSNEELMKSFITKTPLLNEGSEEEKRAEILEYFRKTYELDEKLYETLRAEEVFYQRADPLRHPLIFYYGHTAVFFINKLILGKLIEDRVNPQYESIFAIGVDEMSWDDLDESHYNWPSLADVKAYRDKVREIVENVIRNIPLQMPITWDSPVWAVLMGIEHERIHIETSSVLIRQLPLKDVQTHHLWKICPKSGDAPENELIEIESGEVKLGKDRQHPLYGWDNEYGRHHAKVQHFKAAKYLTSNAEFLKFIEDGGYATQHWWTPEGWAWRNYQKAEMPRFWRKEGDKYRLRTMVEEIPMPWDWPVEINYLEAKAFCNWKTEKTGQPFRLPTEEEWYLLYNQDNIEDQPYWKEAPGNINLEHYASSCPVNMFQFGDFFDMIGNVWQWTETPISGFHGFEVHLLYDDFSTPTFDLKHNLIKGGSWISTGNEATKNSRYAFRRHFYQHAGFRYIQTNVKVEIKNDMYKTDFAVSQYCEAHYGEEYYGLPNFPKQCADICLELTANRRRERALDLGCAVGRSTFELAREFDHVTGVDFSARFIRVAIDMKEKGYTQYILPEEGDIVSYHERHLEDLKLDKMVDKVEFFQTDASNLKPIYTDYDLVLAGNLIDRMYNPAKFLTSIHERIRKGGLLVITSPYTWLEEFTEKENWIGGFKENGENVFTIDGLHRLLKKHFRPVGEPRDIPFVIRETKRKFQHSLSEMTVWERI